MPKITASNAFSDLQSKGIISKEDPNALFTDLHQIGAGNFGIVYRARDKATGENVAIKKLKFDAKRKFSSEDLNDMIREIEFLSIVKHKNCIESKGCYLDHNIPWLVMEYCLGSVADILEVQKHPLKECEIAAIVKEVLCGLVFLHRENYIHRDIKAGNILFSENGGVKISDFGSASFQSPANSFVGTPFWIAPEVIMAMESGLYDTRADVWSVGITCIEMAELKPPYMESANSMAALYQIALNPPPKLRPAHWSSQFHNFVDFLLQKKQEDRPTSAEALSHPFCSSVRNPTAIISELVQLALANANEENQMRPRLRKALCDNGYSHEESSPDAHDSSAGRRRDSQTNGKAAPGGVNTPGDVSYDGSHRSVSTADDACARGSMGTPNSVASSMSGLSVYMSADRSGARQQQQQQLPPPPSPSIGIWNELAASPSQHSLAQQRPQQVQPIEQSYHPQEETLEVQEGIFQDTSPLEPTQAGVAAVQPWGAVYAGSTENRTAAVSKQAPSGDTALSKTTVAAPGAGQIAVSPVRGATAAAKIGNFPTLKTQRMLRRAQGAGVGGAEDSSAFLDKFYSFGALRRLCHRHTKKLAHEITRLTELEEAKKAELNREFTNFINAKKKAVGRLQEQHERDRELAMKKATEDETKYLRQLEADVKAQMKMRRKSYNRPKSMAGFPGSGSPFNDPHGGNQPELDQLYKRLQSESTRQLQLWRYSSLCKYHDLQLTQFAQRTKLQEEVANEKAALLLNQHEQLRAVELQNQGFKHQLQRCHLEEKRNFLCEEQVRYDDSQKVKFEKEKRIRMKQLEKELKHLEELQRPTSKVANWFLGRRKQPSDSPNDKSRVDDLLKEDPRLTMEEIRKQKKEALERQFEIDAAALADKVGLLRAQMVLYQDHLSGEFHVQQKQEETELRNRIALRAEKLEEAIKRNAQAVSDENAQVKRRIEMEFAARKHHLQEECQKLGVDFQALQLAYEESVIFGHVQHQPGLATAGAAVARPNRSSYLPP
uniref:non-specific serine/threonine protein kinase n=1 Tax=Schistocephalus solidus TaxID=70667 RepID=A0A0X3PWU6_SCHSO